MTELSAYAQAAVNQNDSICAVISIPAGRGFTVTCPLDGDGWQTAPGQLLFSSAVRFTLAK